jgi:hypothetical protein
MGKQTLKLFLVSRTDKISYDEYDSMVVAAASDDDARRMTPSPLYDRYKTETGVFLHEDDNGRLNAWPMRLSTLSVRYIGVAEPGLKPGVIIASFNAG